MEDWTVTLKEMASILGGLDTHKATDPDNIRPAIFKPLAYEVFLHLTDLFDLSLTARETPGS